MKWERLLVEVLLFLSVQNLEHLSEVAYVGQDATELPRRQRSRIGDFLKSFSFLFFSSFMLFHVFCYWKAKCSS